MEKPPTSTIPKRKPFRILLIVGLLIAAAFIVWMLNSGGTATPPVTPTPTVKSSKTPAPSKTPTATPTPAAIDLNGLWRTDASAGIKKITQTGNSVVISWQEVDPNSRWQEKAGDVTVQATLNGNKLTGQIRIITEKGYCDGSGWWHAYSATVSEDGRTIREVYTANKYWRETCQETGEYPQKTDTLTKI